MGKTNVGDTILIEHPKKTQDWDQINFYMNFHPKQSNCLVAECRFRS